MPETMERAQQAIARVKENTAKVLVGKEEVVTLLLAAIAALAVAVAAFLAFRGGKAPAPAPEPTAVVEITAEPASTPEPTQAPTAAPTATAAPTEVPGPVALRDTDFPALTHAADQISGSETLEDDQEKHSQAPFLGLADVRRRDVRSVTFLPSLEGSPFFRPSGVAPRTRPMGM